MLAPCRLPCLTMGEKLSSAAFIRALTWVSALVLIAGVAAAATVWIGGDDGSSQSTATPNEPVPDELPEEPKPSADDVPAAARKVAAQFITAAVGREDLALAWTITHPDLKKECACTREQWLTGNIPVQVYPTEGADTLRFGVNEVSPGRVVLEVLLAPPAATELPNAAFYIGLRAVGTGDDLRWLVDYWAPIGSPPVPEISP